MFNYRNLLITGTTLLTALTLSQTISAQVIPPAEPEPPKGWS